MQTVFLRLVLVAIFLFVSTEITLAQSNPKQTGDTIYYKLDDIDYIEECPRDLATAFGIKEEFNAKTHPVKISYLSSGEPMAEYEAYDKKDNRNNSRGTLQIKNGNYTEWYSSGKTRIKSHYIDDRLEGDLTMYFANGIMSRSEKWKKGECVSGDCFNEKGEKIEYTPYRELPSFEGGISALYKYIGKNLSYPKSMAQKGVHGLVKVRFVIDKKGNVSDVTVLEGVNPDLDREAARIVSQMPKWNPGSLKGRPTSYYFVIPIRFSPF
jgi:TonB family protein